MDRRAAPVYLSSRKSSIFWFSSLAILVRSNAPTPEALESGGNAMLTWSRRKDLFWTFFDSLYLTTFKLLFIGSSAYIIYLMLNDYKPTHDPNIDTFKVQYLLGISAILALLFPHDYRFSEVGLYPRDFGAPVSNDE